MTAPDERVWLTHPETGGFFNCPAGAVEAWTSAELGWVLADGPPEEPNPVIAELLAAQQAAAVERARLDEPSKSKTWTKTDATPEGN